LQDENVTLQFKETNIAVIINSCIQLLEANALEKNIVILNNIQEDLEAWCDEVSIHTIFRNIISNAIKFTAISGNINITASKTDSEVIICISDNGVGMSAETLQLIFEENQHYSSSGTANEQGTGLGLMLVKDFIKKNNGKIDIISKIGEGTRFSVILPIINY
jgi:signal transduction histidine kinase